MDDETARQVLELFGNDAQLILLEQNRRLQEEIHILKTIIDGFMKLMVVRDDF